MDTGTNDPQLQPSLPQRGWFARTDAEFRRELLALSRPHTYAAGAVIYQAGDLRGDFFVVRAGVVLLHSRFAHADAILLHMVHPGDSFGSTPALLSHARVATASARTPVQVLRIAGDDLRALLTRRPEWMVELGRDLLHYCEVAMQAAGDLLIRDTAARCAAVLLRLGGRRWAEDAEANQPSHVPASQAEIAMMANVSRNTLNEVLRAFTEQGIVALEYRSVLLKDPAHLRKIADGH